MKKWMFYSLAFLLIGGANFPVKTFAQTPNLARADRAYFNLAYADAAEQYLKALKKYPGNKEIMVKLADCYRRQNDFTNAEYWYKQVTKFQSVDPINKYYYGRSLMNNRKYDEAEKWFAEYLKERPEDVRAQRMLDACQTHEDFMMDASLWEVKPVNINTSKSDFSPVMKDDQLYFASARGRDPFVFRWNEHKFLDIYVSTIGEEASLSEPRQMKGTVNTKFHEATATFSPKGDTIYFTRNNFFQGKIKTDEQKIIRLKTYSAYKVGGKYLHVKDFPFNSDDYSVGHPCLSPDGKGLYFASDMPNGFGGTDIYRSFLGEKGWGQPENLGPTVNTPGNEMFPWIGESGDLYFASEGHKGMGGMDIFRAKRNGELFGIAYNLGYPINSPLDDFGFVMDEKKRIGFFSSNRPGGAGDDDVYSFRMRDLLMGWVVEKGTGNPIEAPKIDVYDFTKLENSTLGDEEGSFRYGVSREKGYYLVASKSGYKEAKKRITPEMLDGKDPLILELEPIKKCNPVYTLLGDVVDHSTAPLPGRKVRVILKEEVIYTDENGEFALELAPNQDYVVVATGENGQPDKIREITTKGLPLEDTQVNVRLQMDPMRDDTGKVFYIIYYNYDKHDIRQDASEELDRVVKFMKKYPNILVELTAHTDSRGTTPYNQRLSRDRAVEAYQYITRNGVEKDRLTYQWKGETMLTNDCADGVHCTEYEHQLNRRTEFRFMGFQANSEAEENSKHK
ncbi:MAG: OmpA family protein [Bacteroidia bacterium]|nr:OmpA family protein [Bacteroidia bacterium]